MKIRPFDTQEVSQPRVATKSAPSELQATQAKQIDDAATLSLRSVSNTSSGAASDTVASIKAQVEAGTYAIDSTEVAKKLAVELL